MTLLNENDLPTARVLLTELGDTLARPGIGCIHGTPEQRESIINALVHVLHTENHRPGLHIHSGYATALTPGEQQDLIGRQETPSGLVMVFPDPDGLVADTHGAHVVYAREEPLEHARWRYDADTGDLYTD